MGLLCVFAALFTFLSLISYSHRDPSWFSAGAEKARNICGVIGSHWAALWLQFLGASSFMLCFVLLLSGVALFRKLTAKQWSLAAANNFLLVVTFTASLGFLPQSLHLGGSELPFGGWMGAELGGLLSRYLNTAGAVLLTTFFFVFALSLSLKISVRDLALYIWWGVSKVSLYIASIGLLVLMQAYAGAKRGLAWLAPRLKSKAAALAAAWAARREAAVKRKAEKLAAEAKAAAPAIIKPQLRLAPEPAMPHVPVAADGHALESPDTLDSMADLGALVDETGFPAGARDSATDGPQILQGAGAKDPSGANAVFLEDEELPPLEGEAPLRTSLVDIVKRAARGNDRNVKSALGKKVVYELPPLSFLRNPSQEEIKIEREELLNNSRLLEEKLADFRVEGKVTAVKPGPVVTMYEFKPGPGIKVNAIANLADDLALALSADSVRIVAPIPGRDVVGIEVPNQQRERVFLKEILGAEAFQSRRHAIPIAVGKDILGEPMVADLRKMPHMLVAGATGSGKSVFVNALICSLLYRFTPDELKLVMVDPKQLELNLYEGIPHLLLPVVTEPKKASLALRWAVEEMERRYRVIAKSGMRDADGYNQKLASLGPEAMAELLNKNAAAADGLLAEGVAETMPKLIIVIDELADLMMTSKADVENNICRLAQKARAAGIHLVLATQRPSVDVVTGLIKANLPARISFRLSSKNDSRTIFDCMGAERLVGMGDMLFMPPGESRLVRMHGAFLAEDEIEQITNFWRNQGTPVYREDILVDPEDDEAIDEFGDALSDGDPLFREAMDIVINTGFASASMLQRRLRVGYNRAARMVETMEAKGVVGPAEGSKPRPVLVNRPQSP